MASIFADWTLAELKAHRKELSGALVAPEERANFGDRGVGYVSKDEMRKALAELNAEITRREGGSVPSSRFRVATQQGWR